MRIYMYVYICSPLSSAHDGLPIVNVQYITKFTPIPHGGMKDRVFVRMFGPFLRAPYNLSLSMAVGVLQSTSSGLIITDG